MACTKCRNGRLCPEHMDAAFRDLPSAHRHLTARRLRIRDYPDDCARCRAETRHSGSTGECATCSGAPWIRDASGPKRSPPAHFREPEDEFRWYREQTMTFNEARDVLGCTYGELTCWEGQEGPDAPDWALTTVKALFEVS